MLRLHHRLVPLETRRNYLIEKRFCQMGGICSSKHSPQPSDLLADSRALTRRTTCRSGGNSAAKEEPERKVFPFYTTYILAINSSFCFQTRVGAHLSGRLCVRNCCVRRGESAPHNFAAFGTTLISPPFSAPSEHSALPLCSTLLLRKIRETALHKQMR